jgi:hypothetical protein
MTTTATPRRFERPWLLAMLTYWWVLLAYCVTEMLRHPGAAAPRLVPFFLGLPFLSMALFGLYTGKIYLHVNTLCRNRGPFAFWLGFIVQLLIGCGFLAMAVFLREG